MPAVATRCSSCPSSGRASACHRVRLLSRLRYRSSSSRYFRLVSLFGCTHTHNTIAWQKALQTCTWHESLMKLKRQEADNRSQWYDSFSFQRRVATSHLSFAYAYISLFRRAMFAYSARLNVHAIQWWFRQNCFDAFNWDTREMEANKRVREWSYLKVCGMCEQKPSPCYHLAFRSMQEHIA